MLNLNSEIIIHSKKESLNLANEISQFIKAGDVAVFQGSMGSGKSFFCRQIIKKLCGDNTKVISPTFNLLQIYTTKQFDIYHFDLYRLKHPDEVYELGIEEAFAQHMTLIEWPEIIIALLPNDTIYVDIEIIEEKKRRIFIKTAKVNLL